MSNINDEFSAAIDQKYAYSQEDAERITAMDCRTMIPSSTRPDCGFLRCQIGKKLSSRLGDPLFVLKAFGENWNAALEMAARQIPG